MTCPGSQSRALSGPGGSSLPAPLLSNSYSHHSCLGADAPVGKLVAYHSALRNFLGNEGNATGRGECHGV